ncbi:MAG: Type 1 glutamine amidotransferase-like domain-containing protein [Candidatus Paceibacterota bacterium]
MPTKYILHGGYTRYDNELNRSFFQELTKDVPNGGTVLIVLFATEEEKMEEYFGNFREKFDEHAGGKNIHYVQATKKDFLKQIKSADAIYIQGGDTEKLKRTLNEYSEFAYLIQGKTVAGSSAGAYVLSTYYYTNSQNKVLEGLGILPVRTVCHYQSEIHPAPDGVDPILDLNQFDKSLELVVLKDFEWRVFVV